MKDVAVKNRKLKIGNRKFPPAFTLVELMVVIALIALISAITLPSVVRMFTAGADSQAHNIIAAQLSYARAIAIQNNTYAGVHVQMADPDIDDEACYSAVIIYKDADSNKPNNVDMMFDLADGSKPKKIPGSIAFGQLKLPFVNGGNYDGDELNSQNELSNFTTFTIVFSPSGQVVTNVEGRTIYFNNGEGSHSYGTNNLFTSDFISAGDTYLWRFQDTDSQSAATAITMFDYVELNGDPTMSASDLATYRAAYLNAAGQFLTINVYTGQLFPRK